jgi:hypothetical protein
MKQETIISSYFHCVFVQYNLNSPVNDAIRVYMVAMVR